jgi:hypothetical protein
MGLCVLRSKPVKMSRFLSSGRTRVTSSSSVIRPRSTHCKAATVVMSLVHEARQKVASTSSGTSKPSSFTKRVPNGFWKCALPVHSQSPWSSGVNIKGIYARTRTVCCENYTRYFVPITGLLHLVLEGHLLAEERLIKEKMILVQHFGQFNITSVDKTSSA